MNCWLSASAGRSATTAGGLGLSGGWLGAMTGRGAINSVFSETGMVLPMGGTMIGRSQAGQSNDWRTAARGASRDLPHWGHSKRMSPTGMVISLAQSGQESVTPTSFSSALRWRPQCLQMNRISNIKQPVRGEYGAIGGGETRGFCVAPEKFSTVWKNRRVRGPNLPHNGKLYSTVWKKRGGAIKN